MPYIRARLALPNDDTEIIHHWLDLGVDNKEHLYYRLNPNENFLCVAAGPSLEAHFDAIIHLEPAKRLNIISSDGATEFLLERSIYPSLVITDLDGLRLKRIQELVDNNTQIAVLAHGDNRERIGKFVKNIDFDNGDIIWCTQGEEIGNWVNTLGFTDGDRAISIARNNMKKGKMIFTIGYDLRHDFIGRYSKPPYYLKKEMTTRKRIKLEIAYKLIKAMSRDTHIYTRNAWQCPGIEYSTSDLILLLYEI